MEDKDDGGVNDDVDVEVDAEIGAARRALAGRPDHPEEDKEDDSDDGEDDSGPVVVDAKGFGFIVLVMAAPSGVDVLCKG